MWLHVGFQFQVNDRRYVDINLSVKEIRMGDKPDEKLEIEKARNISPKTGTYYARLVD